MYYFTKYQYFYYTTIYYVLYVVPMSTSVEGNASYAMKRNQNFGKLAKVSKSSQGSTKNECIGSTKLEVQHWSLKQKFVLLQIGNF